MSALMNARGVLLCVTAAIMSIVLVRAGISQSADPLSVISEESRRALAAPFTGVTTNGRVIPGLFPIRRTGVATRPIRVAAEAFLNGLDEGQRVKVSFRADDRQWRIWNSFPVAAPADGLSFEQMSERQRELAFHLFRASLSVQGLQKLTSIMKLNGTFAELRANEPGRYGQWKYWLALMGTPSEREPWGWQLEGHHLVINYFVLRDQVVMTPTFMGAQPVVAETGSFKGTMALRDEQDKALKLFTSLSVEQRATATIGNEKGAMDTLAGIYKDNLVLDYAGIRATLLDQNQRAQLLDVIAEFMRNEPDGRARLRMNDVERYIDSTYFAWIGNAALDGGPFYYRLQSPVILIEFDHQGFSRNHIHTVVRTPNGNDYGKDLLRQHYAEHPHPAN